MGHRTIKNEISLQDSLRPMPVHFFPLLSSALGRYLWPTPKRAAVIPASLSKQTLLSGAVCSGICAALLLIAILTLQIAYSRIHRNNRLELSQDVLYAICRWTFLLYDLVHIYVIGVFACWLVRSLRWEAWIGGSAMILASLVDFASLSVDIFLQTPALSALANGEPVGFSNPEAGYDVVYSTLDFARASFALVGSFFLAGAAMKAQGTARLAGWFIIAGVPIGIFQIAAVGLHAPWTVVVADWITPISEIGQHLSIALCLWELFRRKVSSTESKTAIKGSKHPALVDARIRTPATHSPEQHCPRDMLRSGCEKHLVP